MKNIIRMRINYLDVQIKCLSEGVTKIPCNSERKASNQYLKDLKSTREKYLTMLYQIEGVLND